jgi:hypothetical protein
MSCDCDRARHGCCDCRWNEPAWRRSFDPAPILDLFTQRVDASRALGLNGTRTSALFAGAPLTVWQADRYAVRLGMHPAQIWPEWATEETV